MATGRRRNRAPRIWLALAFLASSGCAQSGPFASRQATVGGLKSSLSQLEIENDKLKAEVGELKADNARLDNQLAQEREANGEITARLDDAKQLLRQNGNGNANLQAFGTQSRGLEDEIPPPVTVPPSSRRVKTPARKPPAAQIRQPEPAEPFGGSGPNDGFGYQPTDRRGPRDVGDDSPDDRWLPVARGLGTPVVRE